MELPKSSVIWSRQDGPRPAPPFVVLTAYSHRAEAMGEVRKTKIPGVLDVRSPTAFVLEVSYFGSKGSYPVDIVDDFVHSLERPTVVDRCFAEGVAFLYAGQVQDLTGLLGNGQQFEPRAVVDLHCRYTAQTIDDPGYIEELDAVAEIGERVDITGKLIHGNLIEGEEPDLSHALDVDFSCSVKER